MQKSQISDWSDGDAIEALWEAAMAGLKCEDRSWRVETVRVKQDVAGEALTWPA